MADARGVNLLTPLNASRNRSTILDQPVRWFLADEGIGVDIPADESVIFPFTRPDGDQGFDLVRVMAENAALAEHSI